MNILTGSIDLISNRLIDARIRYSVTHSLSQPLSVVQSTDFEHRCLAATDIRPRAKVWMDARMDARMSR